MAYNLTAELFAEWAIGLCIIAIRIFARWKTGKFYWDDLFLGFVTIFWTFHTVFLHLCTEVFGSNIGLNEKSAMEIPDEQVPILRQGSIHAFIAWLSYIFMVWSFKGVLMFLYNRLTMGVWQHRVAQVVGVACVCTFLASLFFHLFICYPVSRSWRIKPYAGDECTLRPLNYIVIEALSIATDLGMLCVPIPLVLTAKIPRSQKLILCALFGSGVFVMVAAFLRAYYSVKDISTLATALGWASREALVSVITVCAPGLKPLFSNTRLFRSYNTGGVSGSAYKQSQFGTYKKHGGGGDLTTISGSVHEGRFHELSSWNKTSRTDCAGESQERIIDGPNGRAASDPSSKENGAGIMVTTDVTLSEETASQRAAQMSRP